MKWQTCQIDLCYKMSNCLIQAALFLNIFYTDYHNRIEIKSKLNLGREFS